MKKFFAVLLAVLMLPVFALAEEAQSVTVKVNDTLSIAVNVPDGYAFDQTWYGDVLYAQIKPEEEGKLLMVLSLGYSEEYADRSINDLSDEELDSLIAVSVSDFANPTYTLSETAEGTKLIIIDENSGHDEYAEIFTVYQGLFHRPAAGARRRCAGIPGGAGSGGSVPQRYAVCAYRGIKAETGKGALPKTGQRAFCFCFLFAGNAAPPAPFGARNAR